MRLEELSLEHDEEAPQTEAIRGLLHAAEERLQTFWDQWHRRPIEQYVACDFDYVASGLHSLLQQTWPDGRKWLDGNTFCEWGSGFGIVTGLAALMGLDAVGIEAESFLVEQARDLLRERQIQAEIWQGNFLPRGAERLATHQSNHASLFHQIPPAYEEHAMELDDFALIFAYPWPGEEHFLREVFAKYARKQALLMMFRGPYQLELYRKC